jgi:hypothetical protein
LIPFGLLLGYIAFLVQHNKKEFVFKKVVVASMSVALLFSVLYVVAHTVPSLQNHHDEVEEHHH